MKKIATNKHTKSLKSLFAATKPKHVVSLKCFIHIYLLTLRNET